MTDPAVLWPAVLGLVFLVAGLITYRRGATGVGPVLVAAALAAFAGEHFTAGPTLAQLVPKWLPARLVIAYVVGAAHLAAATSFVTRRYVRWAGLCLAAMFALFVLLMDLPGAVAHPGIRINWSLAAREATFSVGALALFASETRERWPGSSRTLATVARIWTACVLVFYGIENMLYPQYSPGVPDVVATPTWVPAPAAIATVTGVLLVACGSAMFLERHAGAAASAAGAVMVLLTIALYVPQFFIARDVPQHVLALNFVYDTLLFGGMMLVIGRAILATKSSALDVAQDVDVVAVS